MLLSQMNTCVNFHADVPNVEFVSKLSNPANPNLLYGIFPGYPLHVDKSMQGTRKK